MTTAETMFKLSEDILNLKAENERLKFERDLFKNTLEKTLNAIFERTIGGKEDV